jgi:anthranilate phosphoribosyltransferase
MVVHGHDGLDEISVCAPTRVSELADGRIRTYEIYPEQYFDEMADPEALAGGIPAQNAAITRAVLDGEAGPRRNVVLLNASAALVCAGRAQRLEEGVIQAAAAIDTGAARAKLEALVRYSRDSP